MFIAFKSKSEITWATTSDNIVGRKALWADLSFLLGVLLCSFKHAGACNWEFFRQQWEDYEVATGLEKQDSKIRLASLRSVTGRLPSDIPEPQYYG